METFSKKTRAMHIREKFFKAMHITKSRTISSKPKSNHNSTSKPCSRTFSPAIAMDNINSKICSTTALNSYISSKPLNSNSTKPSQKHAKKGLSSSLKKLAQDIKAQQKSIAARHQLLADLISSSPPIAALRFLSVTVRRSASKNPKQKSSRHGAGSTAAIPLSDDLSTPSSSPNLAPSYPRPFSRTDPVHSLQVEASSASDRSDLISMVASSSTESHVLAPPTKPQHYTLFAAAFLTAAFVVAISAGKTFALALTGASYLLVLLKGKLLLEASQGRKATLPFASEDFRRSLTVPHHRASQLSPSKVPNRSNSLPLDSGFAQFCAEKQQASNVSLSGNLRPKKENLSSAKIKLQVMLLVVLFGLLQGKVVAISLVLISCICIVPGISTRLANSKYRCGIF